MTSCISRFYRLSLSERRERIAEVTGLEGDALARLQPAAGLNEQHADRMVENALGVFGLPLGVCVNLQINGRDVLAPMVVEEPSVVAACSYASKLLRTGGGVQATCSAPIVVGQIQVLDVPDTVRAEAAVLGAEAELLALADAKHPRLCGAGGGARSLSVRLLPSSGDDDPCGDMFVVHLAVDVREAMGANAINSMCERLAPRIAELTGGRTGLRILSNLTDQRTVTVTGRIPYATLEGKGAASGELLAQRIQEASVFAERDPYRACTHNKGIMNGVDAALIALGQDWRAVEAGAHAYAAREGRYTAMARWRAEGGHLVGRMTIPLAVGTVGGVARSHPVVPIARGIAKIRNADDVAQLCAAVGLAQNFGALRALAAEGIQHGHMRLHARNIAVEAGAEEHEVIEVARRIADAGQVNARSAAEVITELRGGSACAASGATASDERQPGVTPRGKRPPTPVPPARNPELPRPIHGAPAARPLRGTALVSGEASGPLGARLIRRLLEENLQVCAHVDPGARARLAHLPVRFAHAELERAMQGVDCVFHCATETHRDAAQTNAVLRAARAAGVGRVVVTTELTTADEPVHEQNETLRIEREALAACVDGLDVVLVASAHLVGSQAGIVPGAEGWLERQLLAFANASRPIQLPGRLAVLAASDAVEGHMLAMTRGRRGHSYELSTCTLSEAEVLSLFEEVSGRPRKPRLPDRVLAPVVNLRSRLLGELLGGGPHGPLRAPAVPTPTHSDAAARELGFRPTDIRRAVHAAYLDFARRGLVPSRPGTTDAPVTQIAARPRRRRAGT